MISRDLLVILGLCLVVLLPADCQPPTSRPTRRPIPESLLCRKAGTFPMKKNCRAFLSCGSSPSEGIVMWCPIGTTYNSDVGKCDRSKNVSCLNGRRRNNNNNDNNNNNNFNSRRPNNNNNFNSRRPNNNNNFNSRRPNNNNNNNFNSRRPSNNNNNNFNSRRPSNNNNFNNRRTNNQRNARRNVFQGSRVVIVPLTLPRGQDSVCDQLEDAINNDFRSRVQGAVREAVPNIPYLNLTCTFENRNQNQNRNQNRNQNQNQNRNQNRNQNPNWFQFRG